MSRPNAHFCNKSLLKEEANIENGSKTFQHATNMINPANFVGNFQLNDTNTLYDDEHTDADNEADDETGMLRNNDQMSILNENTYVEPLAEYPFQNYNTHQRSPRAPPTPSYDMLMGPPASTSNSNYTFDYTVQDQRRPTTPNYASMHPTLYHAYPPQMTNSQHMLLNYNNSNSMKQQTAQFSGGTHFLQPNVPQLAHSSSSFYNKIWYPNAASTISTNRSCSTLRSNMYFNGPSCSHSDPMMDMLQLSNSGREARNRAEKNRRDKLNSYIQDLSGMVPHVAESPRRVDKTAVLRFAVHGLRLNYVFNRALSQSSTVQHNMTDTLMQLMESFFLTITCRGEIVLVSSSVEQHLGHCQTDLYGQNILHITHPEDHHIIKQQLIPTDIETLFSMEVEGGSDENAIRTKEEQEEIDRKLAADKRSFTIRLARAGPRSEPTLYEVVKIDGSFRCSDLTPKGGKATKLPASLIRRSRTRDDSIPMQNFSANDIVLVGIARVIHPPKISDRLIEANKLEYRTRHLIDGRIVDCDQRISLVTGYMKSDVSNLSPFSFMHQDDARWTIVALRQMYDHHSSYGESTHRLLTRSGSFIYLHTRGYLEIDKNSNKVHSFVCINTLLSDEEGRKKLQEMKNKFSIIINANIPQSSIDVPASENPQQLEKAVMCLIQNLQKSVADEIEDDEITEELSTSPLPDSVEGTSHKDLHPSSRSVKSPMLALVPPETDSVKDSLSKSVSMVSVAAARLVRESRVSVKSPQTTASGDSGDEISRYDSDVSASSLYCTCLTSLGTCDYCQQTKECRLVGGGRKRRSTAGSENDETKIPKYRLTNNEDIQQVLSNSLDHLGRSLNRQINVAMELHDHGVKFEMPNTQAKIHQIMVEHQKQNELYVNIKTEFEVQLQNNAIDMESTKNVRINDEKTPSPPPDISTQTVHTPNKKSAQI